MALTDYQLLVDAKVRDDTERVSVVDRDNAINSAVLKYSDDKPNDGVEDIATTADQVVGLPTNWVAGFSSLKSIEYPIDEYPPCYIEAGAYGMYNHPSAGQRIMLRDSLTIGTTVRVAYTLQHIVDDNTDTPPIQHRESIANYAASLLLDHLATRYAGDSDSTIQADTVDHANKSRDFAARAKRYRDLYYSELGIKQNAVKAASATVDLDLPGTRLLRKS